MKVLINRCFAACRSSHPARVKFTHVLAGVGIFFAIQYVLGLWRLTRTSSGMENKFSAIARDEYLGFLALQNLHALAAYALLVILGAWLLQPFVSAWSARSGRGGTRWILLRAFVLAVATHGWFVLRLVDTRPYFLKDIDFGHWYYRILEVVPEAARPMVYGILFSVLPVAVVVYALVWHFRSGRRGAVVSSTAVLACGVFLATIPSRAGNPERVATTHEETPWNVIILGSDSLRGDRIGASGYRPPRANAAGAGGVSPAIDALAARSVHFRHAFTPIASTLESGISLMASQYPHTHGIRHMYPDRETLESALASVEPVAPLLAAKGYDTAAIGDWCAGYYQIAPLGFDDIDVSSFDNFKIYMSQAVIMAHFVIPLYFDHEAGYRLFPQIRSFAQFVTPEVVTQRVVNRLARRAADSRPFFWHVFYSCNHLPFRSPEPYRSMFSDPAYNGPHRNGVDFDIDAFIGGTDLESKSEALPAHEVAQIRALYDGTTRMFDDQVKRILEALDAQGLADRTIVIITSDHGDDLYEPGVTFGHGQTMNGGLQSFHVPMIVHIPGREPQDIEEAVNLLDLAPTLADLLGFATPASWEGKSFAGWIDGSEEPEWRPFYGETGFPFIQFDVEGVERPPLPAMDRMTFIDRTFNFQFVLKEEFQSRLVDAKQRALRTRNWKLVCTPVADGTRHFALFNLRRDPHGEEDIAGQHPEVLAPMQRALEQWIDERIESPLAAIFPTGEPE
jgi:arylsulfatase A-like enzyme